MIKSPVLYYCPVDASGDKCPNYNDNKNAKKEAKKNFHYESAWWICQDSLRKYFAVPKTATKIQLKAYSKPTKNSVKVNLYLFRNWHLDADITVDGKGERIDFHTYRSIKDLVDEVDVWHVEVDYW